MPLPSSQMPSLRLPKPHKTNSAPLSSSTQTLNPAIDLAETLIAHLNSSSPDRTLLAQTHTRLLRLSLLRLPYHYNSLLRSYLRHSLPLPSLSLFLLMHRSGTHPDRYTLPLALKASSHLYSPSLASQLHCLSVKHGLDRSEYTESGVISSYAKLGLFESARRVFDENAERKVGSWNAMINGYSNGGEGVEVVRLFVEMRRRGVVEDEMTMIGVVSACGGLGDFRLAQQVHKCAIQVKSSDRLDITVSNSLIDMYCKCGRTDLAHRVFSRVSQRNVSTWTSIVTGFATYGQEKLALDFFNKMIEEKIHPNHVTMVAVLNACTHGGLIKEGIHFLENMKELYNIEPNALHYGCVVDMLGRVGRLKEARKVVERMPMGANVVIWGTLLGASEKYGDVKVGEWAAKNLMELEPLNDGVYVVLSNIYAKVGMWEKVERLRKEMRARRVEKVPGYSLATRDL